MGMLDYSEKKIEHLSVTLWLHDISKFNFFVLISFIYTAVQCSWLLKSVWFGLCILCTIEFYNKNYLLSAIFRYYSPVKMPRSNSFIRNTFFMQNFFLIKFKLNFELYFFDWSFRKSLFLSTWVLSIYLIDFQGNLVLWYFR